MGRYPYVDNLKQCRAQPATGTVHQFAPSSMPFRFICLHVPDHRHLPAHPLLRTNPCSLPRLLCLSGPLGRWTQTQQPGQPAGHPMTAGGHHACAYQGEQGSIHSAVCIRSVACLLKQVRCVICVHHEHVPHVCCLLLADSLKTATN